MAAGKSVKRPSAGSRVQRIGILGGTFNPIHLGHLRSAEEVREGQGLDRILFIPSASPPHKRHEGLVSATHRLAMVRRAVVGNPSFKVSTIEIERSGHSYSVDTLRALRARMPGASFSFIMGLDAFREIDTWRHYETIFELCDLVVTSRPPHGLPRTDLSTLRQAQGERALRQAQGEREDVTNSAGETALLSSSTHELVEAWGGAPPTVAETALMDLLPVAVRDQFCYPDGELTHRTGNRILFQRISGLDISASSIRERLAAGLSIRYLVPPAVERYIARHGLYGRRVG